MLMLDGFLVRMLLLLGLDGALIHDDALSSCHIFQLIFCRNAIAMPICFAALFFLVLGVDFIKELLLVLLDNPLGLYFAIELHLSAGPLLPIINNCLLIATSVRIGLS